MNRPTIGVIPLWDETRNSLWMLPGYMDGLTQAGALPVILPLTSDEDVLAQACALCDGFLFTGGHDISPALYGEAPHERCGAVCSERDAAEAFIFTSAVIELDKPAFGICRGLQLFNALLGGTLYQDLPAQYTTALCHNQKPPYSSPSHQVRVEPGSPLESLLSDTGGTIAVNSYHHQGIRELSPRLSCMAVAEDGLIEAVCMPDRKFVHAVQWHPEYSLQDEISRRLFEAFVRAAVRPTSCASYPVST